MRIRMLAAFALIAATVARADEFVFSTPSDDRWFYPFNFNPGRRSIASCFGAAGMPGFNDRDGAVIIAWSTSSLIAPGQGSDAYDVTSIRLTMTNVPGAEWAIDLTPDAWYTFDLNQDGFINGDGIPRGEEGDTDGESDDEDPGRPIEVFGVGFGPVRDYATWIETSGYIGSDSTTDRPRDPYPFVYQDGTDERLHCEDNVKGLHNEALGVTQFTPAPWAVGVPVGYVPGEQTTPFAIEFTIDLSASDGRVRRYVQEQLDGGRLFFYVTSLADTTMGGGQSEYPTLYMKESTDEGARPGELIVELGGGISCDDVRKLTGRCRNGTLKSKVVFQDESHDGQQVTIEVDGTPHVLDVSGRRARLRLRNQSGSHEVCLTDPDCGLCRDVECS